MSGVIDDNGVQWEHCHGDSHTRENNWFKLDNLGYQPPTGEFLYGRMLCIKCVNALPQAQLEKVVPADSWKAKRTVVKSESVNLMDI